MFICVFIIPYFFSGTLQLHSQNKLQKPKKNAMIWAKSFVWKENRGKKEDYDRFLSIQINVITLIARQRKEKNEMPNIRRPSTNNQKKKKVDLEEKSPSFFFSAFFFSFYFANFFSIFLLPLLLLCFGLSTF